MASCSTQQVSSLKAFQFPVVVSKRLLSLIQTVKKVNMVTTFGEVLDGLRIYISERRLYDPLEPTKIYCSEDELSSVLGVEEFTIPDVRKLLQKLVVPVILNKNNSIEVMKAIPPSIGENAGKRKAEESQERGIIKRTCEQQPPSEPMYLYIPPSPAKEESSSESYYESLHGYETSFVKDTSDDSLSYFEDSDNDLLPGDILAIEETFDVEYEVDSDTDDDTKIYMSESCSDSEDAVNTVITFVCKSDSDQEFWADKSSDEEFDSDLEIPESDKWSCKRCGSSNNPPMRYCIKCWSMRSGWVVPKRSEHREHPRRKPRSKKNKNCDKPVAAHSDIVCYKPVVLTKESSSSPKPATSSSSSSAPELSSTSISPTNELVKLSDANACQEQLPSVSSDICSSTDLQSASSNSMQEFPFTSLAPNYTQKYFSNLSSELSSSSQELSSLSSNSSSQELPSTSSYNSSQESSSLSSNSLDVPSTSKEVINSLSNFRTLNLSTVPKCDADSKLCLLCCSKPANASIIHGKYAHQISCYRCAKKLQHENKRCPVCRRTIDRVVYQITAI